MNPDHLRVKTAHENSVSKPTSALSTLDLLDDEFPEAHKHLEAIRKIVRARHNLDE